MENPFNHVTYSKKELVEAGMYAAVLKDVKFKEMKSKKSGEPVPKLIFEFALEDGNEVSQFFTVSQAENSHLIKFLRTLGPLTEEIREDKAALWGFIKSKIKGHFHIMVSVNGEYNNITAATPMKSIKMSKPSIDVEGDMEINL